MALCSEEDEIGAGFPKMRESCLFYAEKDSCDAVGGEGLAARLRETVLSVFFILYTKKRLFCYKNNNKSKIKRHFLLHLYAKLVKIPANVFLHNFCAEILCKNYPENSKKHCTNFKYVL